MAEFGIVFDTWQDGLAQLALGLRADGKYAATVGGVILSIPRQVAKTFMVSIIIIALCTLYPGLTVLWTAHRTRTATKTFENIKGRVLAKGIAKYLPRTQNRGVRTANGEQEIRFRNGSRIMFGAREQGFGRGFDEVDIMVFDEAQILTEAALEDMVPAANQSRFPHSALLFFMGTPPRPKDHGEEFANRRKKALAFATTDETVAVGGFALYIECSADPNVGKPDGPDLYDLSQLATANPAYPHRVPQESIDRMREQLTSDASWRREALGVWDGDGIATWDVIGADTWANLRVEEQPADGQTAYAVRFSPDGENIGLAAARTTADGVTFSEVINVWPLAYGIGEALDFLSEPHRANRRIVVDGKSGSDDFAAQLIDAGVKKRYVSVLTPNAVAQANSALLRSINEGTFTHSGQLGLDEAVKFAIRKAEKSGAWYWVAATPETDVTSLQAVTLARYAAADLRRIRTGTGKVVIA